MRQMNEAFDFHKHIVNKDIDSRIKKSRDDTLKIIQADIKVFDSKVDSNFEVLDSKIDKNFEVLNSKIDNLAGVMKSDHKRLDDKIDNVVSMKKWVVGIFVTILLAVAALAVPVVLSLLS